MSTSDYPDSHLRDVLSRIKTIAAVGVSVNQVRPSYYVARYLHMRGYNVLPVNPVYAGQRVFGQRVYKALRTIPKKHDPIQMVEIFRKSEDAGHVVDEALDVLLDRGLEVIWMQIGVVNEAAAKRARAKGIEVLMNVCPKMEHQRIGGELRNAGFNTGIISSKLPTSAW